MEEELNDLIAQVDELYGPRIVSELDAEVSLAAIPPNSSKVMRLGSLLAAFSDHSEHAVRSLLGREEWIWKGGVGKFGGDAE